MDAFRAFVREKGGAITAPDLQAFMREREARAAQSDRKAAPGCFGAVGLGAAGVALLAAWGLYPGVIALQVAAGLALVGAVFPLIAAFLEAMPGQEAREQRDAAAYALNQLAAQDDLVEQAEALGRTGFVLFLRSFDVEDSGASQAEVTANQNYSGNYDANMRAMTDGHYGGPPAEVLSGELPVAANVWTDELDLLTALRGRMPVALLENILASDSKRAELSAADVLVVPVLLGDWWAVFLRLYARCRFVVIFVDRFTPALQREMTHLAQARERPYFAVLGAGVRAQIENGADPMLTQFAEGAAARIAYAGAGTGAALTQAALNVLPL